MRRRPAKQHLGERRPLWEATFPGDRRVLVRQPLDPWDIAREKSEYSRMPEGKRHSVSVAELTRMEKRLISGSRRLIRIPLMPERPGQKAQRARTNVLGVAEREFAVLLRPIE